jgi:hypothetical protein
LGIKNLTTFKIGSYDSLGDDFEGTAEFFESFIENKKDGMPSRLRQTIHPWRSSPLKGIFLRST